MLTRLVDVAASPFIKKLQTSPDLACNSRKTKMVLATVYNIDEKVKQLSEKTVYFNTDTDFVICDNSANTHICNNKKMFTQYRDLTDIRHIVTIGGKNSKPTGIGSVKWSWQDDNGRTHEYELQDVYYFLSRQSIYLASLNLQVSLG